MLCTVPLKIVQLSLVKYMNRSRQSIHTKYVVILFKAASLFNIYCFLLNTCFAKKKISASLHMLIAEHSQQDNKPITPFPTFPLQPLSSSTIPSLPYIIPQPFPKLSPNQTPTVSKTLPQPSPNHPPCIWNTPNGNYVTNILKRPKATKRRKKKKKERKFNG